MTRQCNTEVQKLVLPTKLLSRQAARQTATRFGFLLAILLLACASLQAQGRGRISGTIADNTGALIPSATIVATESGTGFATTVVSNSQGEYVFPALKPTVYSITVKAATFETYKQENVVLDADQSLTVNATLKIGGSEQTVTVTSEVPLVDTTSSTLSQVVNTQQVNELPLNGRNAAALSQYVAGVAPGYNFAGADSGITKTFPSVVLTSIGGLPSNLTAYLLDGGNNVDEYTEVNDPFPMPDTLQEYSVQTSNYNAQYGESAGGVINIITKSGTNKFHGDLFEYVRNGDLNAANYFGYAQATPSSPLVKTPDPLKRNQFGGTVGGPIWRDKAYFFFGTQTTNFRDQATSSSAAVTPTAAQIGSPSAPGQFSSTIYDPSTCTSSALSSCTPFAGNQIPYSRYNPASLALLNYLPTPSASGQQFYKKPQVENFHEYTAKGDYQPGTNDHISLRYFLDQLNNAPVLNLKNLLTYADGSQNGYHNALFAETHTFGPSLVNNFILDYLIENDQRGPKAGSISVADLGVNIWQPAFKQINGISVSNAFSVGDNPQAAFRRTGYSASDDLQFTRGTHSYAFGFAGEIGKMDINNALAQPGSFAFSGAMSGNNIADFLMGYLSTFGQGAGQFLNMRIKGWGLYAQDAWKISHRLTLNYGIRYEPFLPNHELMHRNGLFNETAWALNQHSTLYPNAPAGLFFVGDPGVPTNAIKPNLVQFMPRLGFAYDALGNGRTSVRGGFGMFYADRQSTILDNYFTTVTPFVESVSLSYLNPTYHGYTTGDFENPYAGSGTTTINPFPVTLPLPSTVAFPTATYTSYDGNGRYKTTVAYDWNLVLEQQLQPNLFARIAYVGTHMSHGYETYNLNPVYNQGANVGKRVFASIPTTSTYGNMVLLSDQGGSSDYHALSGTLKHTMKYGLQGEVNYTWSKALNNLPVGQDQFALPVYEPNFKRLDYGPADFNHGNVFSATYEWNIPKMSTLPAIASLVLNGWATSGIVYIHSGDNLTVFSGVNNSGTGNGYDHGVQVSPTVYGNTACGTVSPCRGWLLPASFTVNPSYASNPGLAYGNTQKNAIVGPRYTDWDMALHRYIQVHEGLQFQFRAEYFNIFNHTNFGDPTTTVSSSSFGRITGTNGDPRIAQLSLKFLF